MIDIKIFPNIEPPAAKCYNKLIFGNNQNPRGNNRQQKLRPDIATIIGEYDTHLVKTWTIPMGVYKIKDKDLGEVTVYKFAEGCAAKRQPMRNMGRLMGFNL